MPDGQRRTEKLMKLSKNVWMIVLSVTVLMVQGLTLSWRRSKSYRNQSIDLQSKPIDWFLYDRDLRHERVDVKLALREKLRRLLGRIWEHRKISYMWKVVILKRRSHNKNQKIILRKFWKKTCFPFCGKFQLLKVAINLSSKIWFLFVLMLIWHKNVNKLQICNLFYAAGLLSIPTDNIE